MLELTIRPCGDRIPIEAECLTPDRLAPLTVAEIEKLTVFHGNRELPLAEFFAVRGEPGDGHIRLDGDSATVKWIGAGMTHGRIEVHSGVGMHLGAEMAGGEIEVFGPASDWVGAEMTGGAIHVHGHAGHLVGGVYRGGDRGMKGGTIVIDGDAGNEIGGCMRRGLIAIGGRCGDFAGIGMLAGTIVVLGIPGVRHGAGMKRGTIVLAGADAAFEVLPTFRRDCDYQPQFLALYLSHLRQLGFTRAGDFIGKTFTRYSGDLLESGNGELLVLAG